MNDLTIDSIFYGDKVKNHSLDYINTQIYLQLLQLFYDMSDEDISSYMYFYGNGH